MEYNTSESPDEVTRIMKIIVVGDMGTGKTSLIRKYVEGNFSEFYRITIGVDFASKVLEVNGKKIDVQLWDIAGQERFGSMTGVYYREAVGAIVVFDITRPSTYEMTNIWKDDIEAKVQTTLGNTVPTLLLGNKIDLKTDGWDSKVGEIKEHAKERNYLDFFETSAKEGTNLDAAIERLVNYILENNVEPESSRELAHGVDITETSRVPKSKCCD